MVEYRIILFPIFAAISIIAAALLIALNWIFGLAFLVLFVANSISSILVYLKFLFWPYKDMVDTSLVDIKEVEVPSSTEGEILKAVVVRAKNSNNKEKQPGILFHHGYTGQKEKNYHYIIPLALNGCTILAIDARGHGESVSKAFKMGDFAGVMEDVKYEIDYLENLDGVDKNKLMMVGHSMGAIATLSQGYLDKRLKKIVGMAGPNDLLAMFNRHSGKKLNLTSIILKFIARDVRKHVSEPLEIANEKISPKYIFKQGHPIPDKDRVYLVHCKEDNVVDFQESLSHKEQLNLPDENLLFLEKPERKYMNAHEFVGQSTIISSFLIKIANSLKD
jgi:hypothetical protein